MPRSRVLLAALVLLLAGCGRTPAAPRVYELKGQVLAVKPERNEVLIKHEDIKGFMPAMTMPYKVKDAALLSGKDVGDLVNATLVVEEVDAYLTALTRTGHAAVESAPPVTDAPDVLSTGAEVADALLVDQNGAAHPMSALRGHRVALTFIYTRCPLPDYCPLMNRNFAEVQKRIKQSPELADVRLVTMTMDPAYDTPAVMKSYAQGLAADPAVWSFATGEVSEVRKFSGQFGIFYEPDAQDASVLVHNLRTAIIDPDGRLVSILSDNTWTPAELVADLKKAPAPRH
jgi:protein SCO1/2